MIDNNGHLKIGDFGHAGIYKEGKMCFLNFFSIRFSNFSCSGSKDGTCLIQGWWEVFGICPPSRLRANAIQEKR